MPAPASRTRLLGYEHRADGTVVITRACRIVAVVRGDARVPRLLDDLEDGDAQDVLARWAALTAGTAL
ncbi:hypothetical protein [Streptomyces sp. NPDC053755]|uniref:hypothetical protein n=1 Tax=Streptomyces sp. NPDC053755 TaxID=3155815 RepID=UPI0034163017